MLAKTKLLINFSLSLTMLGCTSLPILAESQPLELRAARQTVENLPNGNYFYGKSTLPNRADTDYIIFRKSGKNIIGLKYRYREEGSCLSGTIKQNTITNVTREYVELGLGSTPKLIAGNSINLSSYNQLRFSQVPRDVKANERLRYCVGIFSKQR